MYNGKDVVIVGRSAFTFEGTFLSEDCDADGRTMIQGNQWLSLIYIRPAERSLDFQFNEELVHQRLAEIKGTTHLRSEGTAIPKTDPF